MKLAGKAGGWRARGRREGEEKGGDARQKRGIGDEFRQRAKGVEFIVFRGTVDLVIRIGARTQRTMTE